VAIRAGGRNLETAALGALGLGLCAYAVARASVVGFTHDESFNYLAFVRRPIASILTWRGPEPTNNHLLNTLLMKLLDATLGPSELVLRLPNLAALPAYLFAAAALSRRTATGPLRVAAFVLLTANPFLLEFFALARGYGLGLALMMLSLHFLLRWIRQGRCGDRAEWLGVGLAALSVLAQPIFLGFYAGVLACIAAFRIRKAGVTLSSPESLPLVTWRSRPSWISGLVVFVLVLAPLPRVIRQTSGIRYFGGRTGLWEDTVGSLVQAGLYGNGGPTEAALISLILGMASAWAAILVAIRVRRDGWTAAFDEPGPLALTLAAFWAAQSAALAHLARIPYLRERAALPFFPLLALVLAWLLAEAASRAGRIARAGTVAAGCLVAASAAAHTARSANLTHTLDWRYDADTRAMLADLAALRKPRKEPLVLGITWYLEPTINFYRETRRLDWLAGATREGLRPGADAYFAVPEDETMLRGVGEIVVRRYPITGNLLAFGSARALDPREQGR